MAAAPPVVSEADPLRIQDGWDTSPFSRHSVRVADQGKRRLVAIFWLGTLVMAAALAWIAYRWHDDAVEQASSEVRLVATVLAQSFAATLDGADSALFDARRAAERDGLDSQAGRLSALAARGLPNGGAWQPMFVLDAQ